METPKNEKKSNSGAGQSSKNSNEKSKSKKATTTAPSLNKSSCYEFDDDEDSDEIDSSKLRSAIREAEGLRPIVKQNSRNTLNKTVNSSRTNIHKQPATSSNKKLPVESSDDEDDTSVSTDKQNNITWTSIHSLHQH